jgi:hypothetical protein
MPFLGPWNDFPTAVTIQSGISTSNSALTLTLPATTGKQWFLCGYSISTRGALVIGDLSILVKDGISVIWRDTIGNSAVRGTRISQSFIPPIPSVVSNAMSIEIPAGGARVFIAGSLWAFQV